MDVTASAITLISSSWSLAVHVKQLIEKVQQHDENAQDLKNKANTLAFMLGQIHGTFVEEKGRKYSPDEQQLRQHVRKVVVCCAKDLKRFQPLLERLLRDGSWFNLAWRQTVAAPEIAIIEKSIGGYQQSLSMHVQLLQGHQLQKIYDMLRESKRISAVDTTFAAPEGQVADSDSILSEVTTLLGKEEPEDEGDVNIYESALLQAFKDSKTDHVESFFPKDKDSGRRECNEPNPLLVAASLGKADVVKKVLDQYTGANEEGYTTSNKTGPESAVDPLSPPPKDRDCQDKSRQQCAINLNQTDKNGRTALHYCAEFGMCQAIEILLNHGVDPNVQDYGKHPPAYFSAKNRKYFSLERLLKGGANADFERPISMSKEIEKLLNKWPDNIPISPHIEPTPARQSSDSTPTRGRVLFSLTRKRWKSDSKTT